MDKTNGKAAVKNLISIILFFLSTVGLLTACSSPPAPTIKVGILHSQTGTMALSEKPVIDATLFAIEEINNDGGVLGKQIEAIVVDTQSDPIYAAEAAEKLIVTENVVAIFGCWTSACRKAVKPVVEKHDSLLFYPVQFEGLENSPNIIYTSSTPNQQIFPAIQWAYQNLGTRFFLVGSDYVFPRAANEIIKDYIPLLGGEIVGEEYMLLGALDTGSIIEKIIDAEPDVILNTINGQSNVAFFEALRSEGVDANDIPTISFSIAEAELQNLEANMAGDYAAWSYFQSINSSTNERFVSSFQKKYGSNRVVDDPMEAAYSGVYIWSKSVEASGKTDRNAVIQNLYGLKYFAPQGFVSFDKKNLFLWKYIRVGQIKEDGQFDIVWESSVAIRPEPYPKSRTEQEWESYLNVLYTTWDNNWVNPGKISK